VEGYPVKPSASGETIPDAFAYTGTRSLFQDAGFRIERGSGVHSRQRVRRMLGPRTPGAKARVRKGRRPR